jgi:hypothetical protein
MLQLGLERGRCVCIGSGCRGRRVGRWGWGFVFAATAEGAAAMQLGFVRPRVTGEAAQDQRGTATTGVRVLGLAET